MIWGWGWELKVNVHHNFLVCIRVFVIFDPELAYMTSLDTSFVCIEQLLNYRLQSLLIVFFPAYSSLVLQVGKLLLNASLYPGIKTNLQKNAVVAIFHTSVIPCFFVIVSFFSFIFILKNHVLTK